MTSEKSKDYCCFSSNHQSLCKQARGPSREKMRLEWCLSSWGPGEKQSPTKQWIAEASRQVAKSPAILFLEYPQLPARSPWVAEAWFLGSLQSDTVSSLSHFGIAEAQGKDFCSFQLTLEVKPKCKQVMNWLTKAKNEHRKLKLGGFLKFVSFFCTG